MKYSLMLDEDIKKAMKERAKDRLEALRGVKSAFMLARTEKGAGSELEDDEEIKIMQKLVKQRKDSAAIYSEQDRQELAEKELLQAEIISEYLPEQMSEQGLEDYLKKLIDDMGAEGMKDMGRVMGKASADLKGKADGKRISEMVRKMLRA